MTNMGIFRQAATDSKTVGMYAAKLINYDTDDIFEACKKIEDLPRQEGETAFPSFAQVLNMVKVVETARHNRAENALNKALVVWSCPVCGGRTTGYITPEDHQPRACKSPYGPKLTEAQLKQRPMINRSLPSGDVCGEIMVVTHDERRAR